MLEPLLGEVATRVLYFLQANEEAYTREIADALDIAPSAVQKQLVRLEEAGVLVSRLLGNVRLFTWNPRYPFRQQLRELLGRAMAYLPPKDQRMYAVRRRPRRPGKPT